MLSSAIQKIVLALQPAAVSCHNWTKAGTLEGTRFSYVVTFNQFASIDLARSDFEGHDMILIRMALAVALLHCR